MSRVCTLLDPVLNPVLCTLQAQPLEDDDPTNSYMLQAGARICKCLGDEFLPYMQASTPLPPRTHACSCTHAHMLLICYLSIYLNKHAICNSSIAIAAQHVRYDCMPFPAT